MGAQIIDVVSFLPERIVKNEDLLAGISCEEPNDKVSEHAFFRGVEQRHFASPDYTSEDLGAKVLEKLLKRTNISPDSIDLILCSCVFSDTFWPGIGSAVQHRVGAKKATMINLDTSCSSFLTGLHTAAAFIDSGRFKNVVVMTVTNFISRLPEFQKSKRSWVLGDGATAALITKGKASIISSYERSHGENYGLMRFEPDLVDGQFMNYWERGCGPITVNFSSETIEKIRQNAVELVPNAISKALLSGKLSKSDVSLLITHQPNTFFLEEWRSRLSIQKPRAFDTLRIYGNLFQGSIPVTLAEAIDQKKIHSNDIVALGTFSNGGDFVSAVILRWV